MNPRIPHLKWRRTPQLYQLSSEKLSIHYASLSAIFNPLHSISNQELFEKHLCNLRIPKERDDIACPSYIKYHLKSEVSITLRCQLCSTSYTAELFEKHLYNQSSHYEKYGQFPLRRKAITCYRQIDTFHCQQR